jgi:hypothetical protein
MSVGAYQPWIAFDQSIYNTGGQRFPEAASMTLKRGTPVLFDSNGRIANVGTSPALIWGVALEDGHNDPVAGHSNIHVQQIRVNEKWVITLLEALAQNMMGLAGGDLGVLIDATSGFWYGSTADAGAQCRIVDYVPGPFPAGFAIGDTKASVVVEFHSTKLQVV